MATIDGLTRARMVAIEAASIVAGIVRNDHLILTRHDGTEIDGGSVRGPQGIQGVPGSINSSPAGGALTGNYPNPGLADNTVTASKIVAALKDAAAATASLRSLGFNSNQAAPGDHTHAGLKDSGWVSFVPKAGEAPFASAAVTRAQYRKIGQMVHVRVTKPLTSFRDLRSSVDGDFANVVVLGTASIPDVACPDNAYVGYGRIADNLAGFSIGSTGGLTWFGGAGAYYHTDDVMNFDAVYMTSK